MPGKLTQDQFDGMTAGFEADLLAIFLSMQADVSEIIDKATGEDPDELINKIDSALKGEVKI
jgi:hypothetical protein